MVAPEKAKVIRSFLKANSKGGISFKRKIRVYLMPIRTRKDLKKSILDRREIFVARISNNIVSMHRYFSLSKLSTNSSHSVRQPSRETTHLWSFLICNFVSNRPATRELMVMLSFLSLFPHYPFLCQDF